MDFSNLNLIALTCVISLVSYGLFVTVLALLRALNREALSDLMQWAESLRGDKALHLVIGFFTIAYPHCS